MVVITLTIKIIMIKFFFCGSCFNFRQTQHNICTRRQTLDKLTRNTRSSFNFRAASQIHTTAPTNYNHPTSTWKSEQNTNIKERWLLTVDICYVFSNLQPQHFFRRVRRAFSLQSHMNLLAIPTRIIVNVKEPLYCVSSLS